MPLFDSPSQLEAALALAPLEQSRAQRMHGVAIARMRSEGAMQSRIVTGPAYWACALINGDHTGMSDAEDKLCAAWLVNELEPLEEVVDVVEDSERFTWSYRLYGGDAAGGDVCDYVVLGPKAGV